MKVTTLQSKIEKRAEAQVKSELANFIDFMQTNRICRLLKFKDGDKIVPFCGHYNEKPLFETGVNNKMEVANSYTNLEEAKHILLAMFVEEETNALLRKIDEMSDYFNGAE